MRAFAPAKVNLTLAVGAKAANGYHPLESLVVFADCGDVLDVAPAERLQLQTDGPFGSTLRAQDDNLVLRAARALQRRVRTKAGARIRLHKVLPIAAGLGGGSADAAAALRALNRLWDCGLGSAALEEIAASLGADVPVCVQSRTRLMRGRGEILEEAPPWPVLHAVLVNPGFTLSTASVFARLDAMGVAGKPGGGRVPAAHTPEQAIAALKERHNDLTAAACAEAPPVAALLESLQNQALVRLARLCGSGPTCMGITRTAEDAAALAQSLQRAHPSYWVHAVRLGGVAGPD